MAEIVIKLVNGELAGKSMQELAKNASAAALELKKAEIGTVEYVKASAKFENANRLMADAKKQAQGMSQASNQLKKDFGGILNQIPGFSGISSAFGAAKQSVGGLTSGFGLLKGAIISTGIGALIILITSLVSWFGKTEAGGNMLSGMFRGITATVDVLLGRLFDIRKTLTDFFSNPIKFFKDLGNDMLGAAKAGYEFVQEMDRIEDAQRELSVTTAQNEVDIQRMITQSKNVGKSYEERLAILDKVSKMTQATYQEELKLAKEKLELVQAEVKAELANQKQKEMTAEQAQKIADAKLAYIALQAKESQVQDTVANYAEKLAVKQAAQQEKKSADRVKDLQEEKKIAEEILQLKIDTMKKGIDQEIAQTKFNTQKKILDLKGSSDQILEAKKLLEEKEGQEIAEIRERYRKDEEDREKQQKEKEKSDRQKDADDKINSDKKIADSKRAIKEAEIEFEHGAIDTVIGFLGIDQEARKKNATAIKAFSIGKILANLYEEIAGYFATADSVATFGVTGTIKSAIAVARAGLAIATVSNQQFESGGFTGYGANDEAAGIVHRNEYVIPAHITTNPRYSGVIGMLENARLNGYKAGGVVTSPRNPFADSSRGAISSANSHSLNNNSNDGVRELTNEFRNYAARIDRWASTLQVNNNVQDTVKQINVINSIRNQANA